MLGSTTSRLHTTACPRHSPCSRLQAAHAAPAACSSLHAARPLASPSQAGQACFLRACSQQTRPAACGAPGYSRRLFCPALALSKSSVDALRPLLPRSCATPSCCTVPLSDSAPGSTDCLQARGEPVHNSLYACLHSSRPFACCILDAGRRRVVKVRADRGGGVDLVDRAVASVVYLVPLADGLKYGRYFFLQFPAFAQIIMPLEPLFRLYYTLPLASLITFFGLYYGVVANQSFSRYVRFNCMQALLLDIILIVPSLFESVLGSPSAGGPAINLYINAYNTVWLFTFACVAYGVGSSLIGQVARLPLIANSADAQVR